MMAKEKVIFEKKRKYIFQGVQFKIKIGKGKFNVYKKGDSIELTKEQVKPFRDLFTASKD